MIESSEQEQYVDDEAGDGAPAKSVGLHRVTRRLLKEVLAEQRKDLGVYQRHVDYAPHRPNNKGLEKWERWAAEAELVVTDLERILKRGSDV